MNPLLIAGAAAALMAGAAGLQTYRLSNAHEALGQARAEIKECARANQSNQSTIEALRDAQARNQTQREAAIRRQQEAAQRVRELEQELNQRGSDDVQIVERSEGECLDSPVPDDIRVRLQPGSGD